RFSNTSTVLARLPRLHPRSGLPLVPRHVYPRASPAPPALIRGRVTVAAAVRNACVPLPERHRKLSDSKRLAKRHALLRSFLFNPFLLTVRRAHDEAASRQHQHLRALSSFIEV